MKPTKVQKYILFTLGSWFEKANEKIKDKPLEVSISKKTFIGFAIKAGVAGKQERALYRNLELLEKSKLVSYSNSELKLTKKGEQLYTKICQELNPYLCVLSKLETENPIKYCKKVQTIFKD
ncbi:MAG: hypothetical protein KJ601_05320 [Nanoarchaeota archaeon]|nr:hypothetical protein [Nanoarchaeota archaeon]MBU1704480.1 hypothetical protein [Nanoarchaeota archaeon]